MANHQLVKAIPIDPEFQAVYDTANGSVSGESQPRPDSGNPQSQEKAEPEDGLLALKRIAEEHQRKGIDRKLFADGSFDQVENDVTNAVRIGWDFLTR